MIQNLTNDERNKLIAAESRLLRQWITIGVGVVNRMDLTDNERVQCEMWVLARVVSKILNAHAKESQEFDAEKFLQLVKENIHLMQTFSKLFPTKESV